MANALINDLVRTDPGTPMGSLLRQFWQPVALGSSVQPGKAIPVRIFGEDLTLYRGESGRPYLVAQRCAHRRTLLHTGWVEDDNLRCMYHGWVYNGQGQCIEMPAEEPSFPPKVRILAYPVIDYAGLVFCFMGAGEPPEPPNKPEIDRGGVQWAYGEMWPCNWLQAAENGLDSVHIAFVHQRGRFGRAVTPEIPKLEVEETEFGIRMRAPRSADNVRINEFHWPNCVHIILPDPSDSANPWFDRFVWYVPVDDEHHREWRISSSTAVGEQARKLERWIASNPPWDPHEHRDELFAGKYPLENNQALVNSEDYVVQVGQGPIVDREIERLGQSDKGVIMLRKLLDREMAALKEGGPTKAWRYPKEVANLPTPPVPVGATE